MKLGQLLAGVDVLYTTADRDMEISGVSCDSRKVQPGDLFVAVVGYATDGNRYISMAREKGAKVVVSAMPGTGDEPYVQVGSDRQALARIGANFYGHPTKKMTMVGVTGTNGKTSTTLLLKHVLETALGAKVGLVGTMENHIGDLVMPAQRTTPESLELQGLFARMQEAGCAYAIMEVSSHAIALDRIDGIHYDVCSFTNLTEDHLDFHKTMEAYAAEKAKLFGRCDKAVINADDEWADKMIKAAACPVLTTAQEKDACLRAEDVELRADGVAFTAVWGAEKVRVNLPIPGKFTVYNALSVLGIALQLGLPLADSAKALATAKGVKGRVEVVPTPNKPYTILIDYAHTPDGLYNVLSSVKGYCKGRLIALFGCGGDRDPIKRPIMGKIGTDIADIAILTSDNPRTEDPNAILQDILRGVDAEKTNYIVIENRPKAIQYAMDIGQKNDIIVLAGKGHETYQEICGVKYPMDERDIVQAYLEETEK